MLVTRLFIIFQEKLDADFYTIESRKKSPIGCKVVLETIFLQGLTMLLCLFHL